MSKLLKANVYEVLEAQYENETIFEWNGAIYHVESENVGAWQRLAKELDMGFGMVNQRPVIFDQDQYTIANGVLKFCPSRRIKEYNIPINLEQYEGLFTNFTFKAGTRFSDSFSLRGFKDTKFLFVRCKFSPEFKFEGDLDLDEQAKTDEMFVNCLMQNGEIANDSMNGRDVISLQQKVMKELG